jgi:hypothetical protein
MKRRAIFGDTLYACIWEDSRTDAFSDAFQDWTDPVWLAAHFERNKGVFAEYPMSIKEAIDRTRDESIHFYGWIQSNQHQLDQVFKPLDNRSPGGDVNEEYKSRRKWLRIYALRVDADTYFVTGGAIKHSHDMDGHPGTKREKQRLARCKSYLAEQGITCKEGFLELEDDE